MLERSAVAGDMDFPFRLDNLLCSITACTINLVRQSPAYFSSETDIICFKSGVYSPYRCRLQGFGLDHLCYMCPTYRSQWKELLVTLARGMTFPVTVRALGVPSGPGPCCNVFAFMHSRIATSEEQRHLDINVRCFGPHIYTLFFMNQLILSAVKWETSFFGFECVKSTVKASTHYARSCHCERLGVNRNFQVLQSTHEMPILIFELQYGFTSGHAGCGEISSCADHTQHRLFCKDMNHVLLHFGSAASLFHLIGMCVGQTEADQSHRCSVLFFACFETTGSDSSGFRFYGGLNIFKGKGDYYLLLPRVLIEVSQLVYFDIPEEF